MTFYNELMLPVLPFPCCHFSCYDKTYYIPKILLNSIFMWGYFCKDPCFPLPFDICWILLGWRNF